MQTFARIRPAIPFCLTALTLLLVLASCKKKNPTFRADIPLHESAKSLRFQEGSYWVYALVGDTLEDSVYVTGTMRGDFLLEVEEGLEEVWDYYRTDLHSSYQDEDYFEVISRDEIRRNAGDTDSTAEAGVLIFAGAGEPGEIRYSADDYTLEVVGPTENLQTGNQTWPLAHVFISYDPQSPFNLRDRYYFVEEVGIVRMEINFADTSAQTWNLSRYRTIPFE